MSAVARATVRVVEVGGLPPRLVLELVAAPGDEPVFTEESLALLRLLGANLYGDVTLTARPEGEPAPEVLAWRLGRAAGLREGFALGRDADRAEADARVREALDLAASEDGPPTSGDAKGGESGG